MKMESVSSKLKWPVKMPNYSLGYLKKLIKPLEAVLVVLVLTLKPLRNNLEKL